jgi:predicted outer membrane repeat protein
MDDWSILGFVRAGTSSVTGITLTRARVEDEGSVHNNDDSGAALSVYGSDVRASAVVITASYAYNDGGGAWCAGIYEEKDSDAPASLTITGSVISDNEAGNGGGGIYTSDCDLTVVDSVITRNRAADDGGGIYFDDGGDFGANILLVRNTTISGNTSAADGGGLQVDGSEAITHRVENSTVSDNVAGGYGGGLYVTLRGGATLVVSNSTISGNSATALGGALHVGSGDVTLVQTTVTLNSAAGEVTPDGVAASAVSGAVGGIVAAGEYRIEPFSVREDGSDAEGPHAAPVLPKGGPLPTPASVNLVGTIVAANPGGDLGTGITAVSTITASSSVIGTIDPGANVVDAGGNQTGVADPGLGALQDNGGPTRTHALRDGSPAIDAGAVPPPSFPLDADDQRGPGYARVMNGRIDVGAFEVQNAAIEPNFTG